MSTFTEIEAVKSNDAYMDVSLGGVILPVPPKSMKIKQSIKIDEIEIPGRSGKVKQAIGYSDSEISVTLEIPPVYENGRIKDTAPDRFQAIQKLFRSSRDAVPHALDIVSTLTEKCGISQVLISSMEVADSTMDMVTVNMTLAEYESIEVQLRSQVSENQVQAETIQKSEEAIAGDELLAEGLDNPDNDYLAEQYQAGKSDAMGGTYGEETPGEDID